MKIKIIKPVWMMEEEFEVGKVYEATQDVKYSEHGYLVDGMLVFYEECEVVEEQ